MLSLTGVRRLFGRWAAWWQAAQSMHETLGREAGQKRSAEQRALSLLLTLLDEQQRREFHTRGYFHVTGGSSGDSYRIRVDSAVNIDVLAENGTVRHHLCARPNGNIPMYDVMAGQLLYLRDANTEKRFLEQANRHVTLSFAAMGRWQER